MLLYRTVLLMVGAGAVIVGILVAFLLIVSWSTTERIGRVSDHLTAYAALQQLYQELNEFQPPAGIPDAAPVLYPTGATELIRRLANEATFRVTDSPQILRSAATLLESPDPRLGPDGSRPAIRAMGSVLAREANAHRLLLDAIEQENQREFYAAVTLAIVLPVFVVGLMAFFRGRVLTPLNDLSRFLGLLARKDYTLAATAHVDPLVRPLFEKYNRMVKRMRDLEQAHLKREDCLQQEVDQATRALFQQQAAMSRIERLAAIGEFAARLGHELRNPLSGVLMALTNLRDEIDSEDQDQRLGLAIAELERIGQLLSNIVDESKQLPERPQAIRLHPLVSELASLVSYQLDDRIRLSFDVPEELRCRLPEAGLRHALLNLVLNAAQALSGRPGTGNIHIAAERTAGALVIRVTDNGPGFPEELLSSGIHDFGSWRHNGTGLGLAAVRRFAVANSGRIRLENQPDGGARVTLTFPLEQDHG